MLGNGRTLYRQVYIQPIYKYTEPWLTNSALFVSTNLNICSVFIVICSFLTNRIRTLNLTIQEVDQLCEVLGKEWHHWSISIMFSILLIICPRYCRCTTGIWTPLAQKECMPPSLWECSYSCSWSRTVIGITRVLVAGPASQMNQAPFHFGLFLLFLKSPFMKCPVFLLYPLVGNYWSKPSDPFRHTEVSFHEFCPEVWMLSFSFLHRSNVQTEHAGIVLMIMREEILCRRL